MKGASDQQSANGKRDRRKEKRDPLMISSECFLAASNPSLKSFLKSAKPGLSTPPIMSTYSWIPDKGMESVSRKKPVRRDCKRQTYEGQLERSSFETHVTGRVGEHEPEVDVDAVSVAVDEDVAVMTILDLQKVRRDRVA